MIGMLSDEEIERLARRFHAVYESWAPSFGWETQPESRVSWDDLPSNQRFLMMTVVREVVAPMAKDLRSLRERVEKAETGLRWLANRRDGLPPQYREFLAPWVALQEGETDE